MKRALNSVYARTLTVALIATALSAVTISQQKFKESASNILSKGCGNGLDENSACGTCAHIQGVAVTQFANCGNVCVTLPANVPEDQVDITAGAAVNNDPKLAPAISVQACGEVNKPGNCRIDWSRFEGRQWYPNNRQLCGRFKNWSADRDITVRITAVQK
jgi:hypothetical protein